MKNTTFISKIIPLLKIIIKYTWGIKGEITVVFVNIIIKIRIREIATFIIRIIKIAARINSKTSRINKLIRKLKIIKKYNRR